MERLNAAIQYRGVLGDFPVSSAYIVGTTVSVKASTKEKPVIQEDFPRSRANPEVSSDMENHKKIYFKYTI